MPSPSRDIRIVTEPQLRAVLDLNPPLVDVVEAAFAALGRDQVIMPPILSMDLPQANGEVDVKTAYIEGFDGFAIKVSPGFFDNPGLGLPSLNGLMVLFCAKTGLVRAVFLDNGYLTDLRTAAAGAVAARHLAPAQVDVAGVLGTGVQARLQLKAAYLERQFNRALIWGRDADKAAACAAELSADLGIEVQPCAGIADLVAQSQLVITTTPARDPLITADMLHPGLHITAMGSDQHGKCEIAPDALAAADLYLCDRISQCETSGELERALAAQVSVDPIELGQVLLDASKGRTSDTQITICDLTGTGAQDTAIATYALGALGDAGTLIRG